MNRNRWIRVFEVSIVTILALILAGEAVLYLPPFHPSLSTNVTFKPDGGGSVTVYANASSTFDARLLSTALLANQTPTLPDILYYYDQAYPVSDSDLSDWFGLSQHLESVAAVRHLPLSLTRVNATQLAEDLGKPDFAHAILIVMSGVLPSTVFTGAKNMVKPWLDSGGSLIWGGDRIGFFSGVAGQPLHYPSSANPGNNGTNQFFPVSWLNGQGIQAPGPSAPNLGVFPRNSPFASALAIDYPYAITNDTLSVRSVERAGGFVLGAENGGYTNLAQLHAGLGQLVYLGAPPTDVVRLSIDLLNLIQSGVITFWAHPVLTLFGEVDLGRPMSLSGAFRIPSWDPTHPGRTVCGFIAQTDYTAPLADTTCAPI